MADLIWPIFAELAALGFGYRPIEVLGYVRKEDARGQQQLDIQQAMVKVEQRQLESELASDGQQQQQGRQANRAQQQTQQAFIPQQQQQQKERKARSKKQWHDAAGAKPSYAARHNLQPFLLYAQVIIMLSAVAALVVRSNWLRRPASPRPAGLLQAQHIKPLKIPILPI